MSSTGRGAKRREHDFYRTPMWCVRTLLMAPCSPITGDDVRRGELWLEPSAGDGAIIRAVRSVHPGVRWAAMEIRPEAHDALCELEEICELHIGNYLEHSFSPRKPFRVCMKNPPYTEALEFVRKAKYEADKVLALLRLDWIASASRRDELARDPPDLFILPNRPSFTGKGTDSNNYAWMQWPSKIQGTSQVHWLPSTPISERKLWA